MYKVKTKLMPKVVSATEAIRYRTPVNIVYAPSNVCDSRWIRRYTTFDAANCNAIVATGGSLIHDIYQAPTNRIPMGKVVRFSAKFCPDYADWFTLFNTQTGGQSTRAWFDVVQGLFGTIIADEGVVYERGMSAFDSEGYRFCWITFDLPASLTSFAMYFSPCLQDALSTWPAAGGEVAGYLRNAFFGEVSRAPVPNLVGNGLFLHWDDPNSPVGWLNGGPNDNNYVEQNPDGIRFVADGTKIYYINQTPPLVSGVDYNVTVHVAAITSGSIKIGASPAPFEEITTAGEHTFVLPGDDDSIAIWNDTACDVVVRNINIWPV